MPVNIALISDTHGFHAQVDVPMADILIHAGDISKLGTVAECADFFDWFSALPHQHKICIAGNHDFLAEKNSALFKSIIPDNIIYLEDESVEVEGFKIWGSPIMPWFFNWAFNRQRGEAIRKYWEVIPIDTDIVVTHGPPHGIGDFTASGANAGCEDLLDILQKIKPRLHVFGHIHEGYGVIKKEGTTFVNASVVNLQYQVVNEAVVLKL